MGLAEGLANETSVFLTRQFDGSLFTTASQAMQGKSGQTNCPGGGHDATAAMLLTEREGAGIAAQTPGAFQEAQFFEFADIKPRCLRHPRLSHALSRAASAENESH